MSIVGINHASFTVSDIEASVNFYRKALGLELLDLQERSSEFAGKATGIKGARLRIAYFAARNCMVELIEYLEPKGRKLDTATNNVGSAHVCFMVEGLEAFLEQFVKEGGRLVHPPLKVPAGPNKGRLMCYGEDPDGNTLEFFSVER